MPSPQPTTSYAATAASALSPALLPDLRKFQIEDENGDTVVIPGDQVLITSLPSNNTVIEAATPSANTEINFSRQTTQLASSSHTPTSATASDGGDDSRVTFISQTGSNDASVPENDINKANIKNKPASTRAMLSIWTGKASTRKAPVGFDPLGSIGSASVPSCSPVLRTRPSRFLRCFPASQDVTVPGERGSPFFADGLTGGLISAMSDIKTQQQKMREDVKSYITSHYASPSPTVGPSWATGTVRWNEYTPSAHAAMDSMSLGMSGGAETSAPTPVTMANQEQRLILTGNPLSPVHELDGISNTQSRKSAPTAHNPQAAPFVPRHTTTLANLEQVASELDEQRSLTVTRPRPSWDQVPNWRSRGNGQGRLTGQSVPEPAGFLTSGEIGGIQNMYPHADRPGRSKTPQDAQPLVDGPLVPATFPHVFSSSSSQVLTTSQCSSSSLGATGKRGTNRTFEPFRPMNAVLNPDAYKQPLSEEDIAFREQNGISLNYHGNHENPRNISADIPERENCSVWITNLPANCTHRDLLQSLAMYRPGRVWASHINAPTQPKHRNAAAKVIFYHPSEAKRFLDLSRTPSGIYVEGRRISAIYNKQRVAAQPFNYPSSRALEIRGDKAIVNQEFLRSLFESHFRFDDEAVEVLAEFGNIRVIEWRFGSMRAQACSAYKLLERMYPCVEIRYATDPCAQYMFLPPQEQLNQLVAPAQGQLVPRSSFGAPGGSSKMVWNTYN